MAANKYAIRSPHAASAVSCLKLTEKFGGSEAINRSITGQHVHTIERWTMYRHILIPTDGSELAEHAVTNGLSLAKSVGAEVTVVIVQDPFDWLSVPETRA